MNEEKKVSMWINRIEKSEEKYTKYHELIKSIRSYYKNSKDGNQQNIFWASIETLKPFLYFKQPKPYVERKDKASNEVQQEACKILEKALTWDIEQFDFDGVIKYARNDYLLSGAGIVYERFNPTFKVVEMEVDNGKGIIEKMQKDIIDTAQVTTEYIDPVEFIADSEKVGVWEECTWVARKINMTKQEVIDQFGEEVRKEIIKDQTDKDEGEKNTVVYEIWDKTNKKRIFLSKDSKNKFLKVDDDNLGIDGFFPMPRPIMTTTTNDSIIPTPDYSIIHPMLTELDGIVERMRLITKAMKISGCYDASFSELGDILKKDNTLVSLGDFDKLKENGGLSGVIDFLPIEQYITALQMLSVRRQEIIQAIYEITGVSDIMRGNSDPSETATAVTKKTNFGTLRNQDRQNDMQRFITDLLKIKAEIICENFPTDFLYQFADKDVDPMIISLAINLLKTDKLRGMVLGIETDSAFDQEGELEKTSKAVELIHDMIVNAFQIISAQPLLLPVYKQMIESVVVTLPNARQYETVLGEAFDKIQQELSQPTPEEASPDMIKAEQQKVKNAQEYEIKKEQNRIKADEVALKHQIEENKVALTNKEMEYQVALKEEEIKQKADINSNITTGFVRGF